MEHVVLRLWLFCKQAVSGQRDKKLWVLPRFRLVTVVGNFLPTILSVLPALQGQIRSAALSSRVAGGKAPSLGAREQDSGLWGVTHLLERVSPQFRASGYFSVKGGGVPCQPGSRTAEGKRKRRRQKAKCLENGTKCLENGNSLGKLKWALTDWKGLCPG